MDCRENSFCSSLEAEEREALCRHCSKRKLTAGSTLFTEDFALKTNLVLSGALVTNTSFGSDVIMEDDDDPAFFLVTKGLIFPSDGFIIRRIRPQYAYNHLVCLTNCEIARFDHDYILDRFNGNPSFARSMFMNQLKVAEHACIFAAAIRSYNVYESVRQFLKFLADKDVVLNHQQIADVTNHSRVSVTKAIGRIKQDDPDLWNRYAGAKDKSLASPNKP